MAIWPFWPQQCGIHCLIKTHDPPDLHCSIKTHEPLQSPLLIDLDPLRQDHDAKPPDNTKLTTTLEKMNHYERDARRRIFWRERKKMRQCEERESGRYL